MSWSVDRGRFFWDWRGRVTRSQFWAAQLGLWIAYLLLFNAIDASIGYRGTIVLAPFMLWALGVVAAKRLHDRGKSGWWLALLLLPVLGPLWAVIELGCLRGTAGANRYGPGRARKAIDYLSVR